MSSNFFFMLSLMIVLCVLFKMVYCLHILTYHALHLLYLVFRFSSPFGFPVPVAGPVCALNLHGHFLTLSFYLRLILPVFCFYTRPLHRMRRCFHYLFLIIEPFSVFICSSDLPLEGKNQAKSVISIKYIFCVDLLLLSCSSFIYAS